MRFNKGLPIRLENMVAENGYKIIEAREVAQGGDAKYGDGTHQMVTDGLSETVSRVLSVPVEPLEIDPAIHRNFAWLDLSEESLLGFASQFGLLGGGICVPIELPGKKASEQIISAGEPVEVWYNEVKALRKAIDLWDALRSDDVEAQQLFFELEKPELPPKLSALVSVGRTSKPTLHVLKYCIHLHIESRVPMDVTVDDDDDSHIVEHRPLSLWAGLWGMLAMEMSDQRQYRSCAQCGSWFEVLTDAKRTTRLYCSDACRMKSYRGRQDQAKRLRGEGVSVEDIALELEADVETVERWIGKGK